MQELAKAYTWFYPTVTDVRMLRIDEFNDLNPAIAAAIGAAIGVGEQGDSGV